MVEPDDTDGPPTWWSCYLSAVERSAISPTAQAVLEEDCRRIVDGGILVDGAGDGRPIEGLRSGLVMGSVQSGKTASMLGVAAMSLDAGTDILVVLAGTRLALWSSDL